MEKADFDAFVGSEIGFLKGINCSQAAVIYKNFKLGAKREDKNLKHGIVSLSWLDSNENEVVIGYKNKKIAIFDNEYKCISCCQSVNYGEGSLVTAFNLDGKMMTGLSSGEIGLSDDTHSASTVIQTIPNKREVDRRIKTSTLEAVKLSPFDNSQIAAGGCENDLSVWDLTKPDKPLFKAKNVPNDMLDLRVPIWMTDLCYLPDNRNIATCSRHSHVRIYDPQARRRPMLNFDWGTNPLTCIAPVPSSEKQFVVGSNHGQAALFDLRKGNRNSPVGVFKDFEGSVTGVAAHSSLPLLFAVSSDRVLRVHHLVKRNLIFKEYLKSRLSCVLVRENLNPLDFSLSDSSFVEVKEEEGEEPDAKRIKSE